MLNQKYYVCLNVLSYRFFASSCLLRTFLVSIDGSLKIGSKIKDLFNELFNFLIIQLLLNVFRL